MNDQYPLSDEQIDRIGAQLPGAASWIDFGRAVATAAVEAERKQAIPEDRAALAEECKALAAQWCSDELALSRNSSATLAPGSLYVAAQKSHDSLNAAIDRLLYAAPQPTRQEIPGGRKVCPDCGKSILRGLYHKHECL